MPKKNKNGRLNELIAHQEQSGLSYLSAVQTTGKGELIGASFEYFVRNSLNNVFPNSLIAVHGFVLFHDGSVSSHFDCIVADRRYPFLATVASASLVPLHAVIAVLEMKTTLDKGSLANIFVKAREVERLAPALMTLDHKSKAQRTELIKDTLKTCGKDDKPQLEQLLKEEIARKIGPKSILFRAIASRSFIRDEQVARQLYDNLEYGDIVILRRRSDSTEEKDALTPSVMSFGDHGWPSSHIWVERDSNFPSGRRPVARRTKSALGWFIIPLIQECTAEIEHRAVSVSDDMNHYITHVLDLISGDEE